METNKQTQNEYAHEAQNINEEEIAKEARKILMKCDPLEERIKYVQLYHYGDVMSIKATALIANSAFLDKEKRLHGDIIGDKSIGKSDATEKTLDTFPSENVKIISDASPKSLYYYAQEHSLSQMILYIDDANEGHISILKTLRNDCSSKPINLTVKDGECLMLELNDRPVTFASSVKPLRDLEGQSTSRALMITYTYPGDSTIAAVKKKIRKRHRYGNLNKSYVFS